MKYILIKFYKYFYYILFYFTINKNIYKFFLKKNKFIFNIINFFFFYLKYIYI